MFGLTITIHFVDGRQDFIAGKTREFGLHSLSYVFCFKTATLSGKQRIKFIEFKNDNEKIVQRAGTAKPVYFSSKEHYDTVLASRDRCTVKNVCWTSSKKLSY